MEGRREGCSVRHPCWMPCPVFASPILEGTRFRRDQRQLRDARAPCPCHEPSVIPYLPDLKSNFSGFVTLAALWGAAAPIEQSKLELDLSRCLWFDANMSAALAAVLARVADRFNSIEIVNVRAATESILRRNGFLTHFG